MRYILLVYAVTTEQSTAEHQSRASLHSFNNQSNKLPFHTKEKQAFSVHFQSSDSSFSRLRKTPMKIITGSKSNRSNINSLEVKRRQNIIVPNRPMRIHSRKMFIDDNLKSMFSSRKRKNVFSKAAGFEDLAHYKKILADQDKINLYNVTHECTDLFLKFQKRLKS